MTDFAYIGLAALALGAALCVYRSVAGPADADRVAGAVSLGLLLVGVFAVLGAATRRSEYFLLAAATAVVALAGALHWAGPDGEGDRDA